MLFALYLFVAAQPDPVAVTQQRLDQLLQRCEAKATVSLKAESVTQVSMVPLHLKREPTDAENGRFACVLDGLRSMPDLQFGFVGNEEE